MVIIYFFPTIFFLIQVFAAALGKTQISGSFYIVSPFGAGISNMTVTNLVTGSVKQTDSSGLIVMEMDSNSQFHLKGSKEAYQDLFIVGWTPLNDFRYTTYMGSRSEAEAISSIMGFKYDPSKGWIVVGLDTPEGDGNLIPAVGASANISGITGGEPYLFDGIKPVYGNTITKTTSSFITWPNMNVDEIGSVHVNSPPGQQCAVSPGQNTVFNQVAAHPDSVTVISYICI